MGYKNVLKREIERLKNSPIGWFISFIFPLIMCLLICFIFGKATPENMPIGVVDSDNSQLSRTIVRDLNTLQSCKVKYQFLNIEEAKKFLIAGKVYAFVVIPKGFQKDISRFKQPPLVFYYNNQRILIGGILYKDVNIIAQSLLVGLDAKFKSKHGLPFKEAVKQSNLINIVDHINANPYFNYQYFLSLIAFGHILQISIILTSVWAIGTEFKSGTTKEWLKEANESITVAIVGKLTPYLLIYIAFFALLYFIYFGIYGVPYTGNVFVGIVATFLFLITCLSFGCLFMSINGNFRYCLSNAAFYTAMGFAFSGITFPSMAMPLVARLYAATMPLNYWIQVMLNQSIRQIPPAYDIKNLLAFFVLMGIALLTLPRLKHLASTGEGWFKL